ncbi:hypothetical protein L6452_27920 [Arctium lappa]|uniref:Uncharacterized protein n=1 Tax=Arctium lappa TaxID=4217 RepID=A0ACB8ZX24_ARCLA|nr:hypothetical protein L6452_27920 [Arctium lappa]
MTSLVKVLNAVVNVRVLVIMVVVRPKRAHAPTGNGERTSSAMVETKIARSCHACEVTSTGFGITKRTMVDEAEMGFRGLGKVVKREGLEVVVKKRRRRLVVVVFGDRRRGGKVGFGYLERRRDRRWMEGGQKAVEKRAEASIAD